MGMEVQRNLHNLFELGDQSVGIVGRNNSGHVLDADGIGAHRFKLLAQLEVVGHVEDLSPHVALRQRIADRPFEMLAVGLDPLHAGFKVTEVVEGVENAEDVNADLTRLVHESPDDIIGVMPVAHQVLPPQEHRKRRFFDVLFQNPGPLPGIFRQEAVHRVKGCPSPYLHGPKTNLIHLLGDGNHVLGTHPRGINRLVTIAKRIVLNPDRIDGSLCHAVCHGLFSFL